MRIFSPVSAGLVAIVLLCVSGGAFAQGSAGGAIGKQGKSVSGDNEQPRQPQSRPSRKSRSAPSANDQEASVDRPAACGRFVGRWDWGAGGIISVNGNGTVDMTNGDSATWNCAGGVYTIRYQMFGNTTTGTVSADGRQFTGSGALGSFVANRVGR